MHGFFDARVFNSFSAVAALVSCGKSNPVRKIRFPAASGVSRKAAAPTQTLLPLPGYQLFAPVTLSRFRLTVLLSHLPSSKLTLSHNLASKPKKANRPPTKSSYPPSTKTHNRTSFPAPNPQLPESVISA